MWLKPVFFLALLTSGTYPTLSSAQTGDEFVFILKARGNPYWNSAVAGIRETGESRGIKTVVYQLENDKAAEEQLNVCLVAIERRPKFLSISAVTQSVGVRCMKEASDRGIPVADMDANISVEEARANGIDLVYTVGSNNYTIGQRAAEYAASILEEASPEIVILEGAAGSIPGNNRVAGFRDRFLELKPHAKIVASVSADWDRLKALNVFGDLLNRAPNIDFVYAANDMMALGALEATRIAGKQATVKIVGVDGTSDALKAVRAGEISATVAQLPYLIGKQAVELAIDHLNGKRFEKTQITPTPIVTKSVIETNSDPNLQYLR